MRRPAPGWFADRRTRGSAPRDGPVLIRCSAVGGSAGQRWPASSARARGRPPRGRQCSGREASAWAPMPCGAATCSARARRSRSSTRDSRASTARSSWASCRRATASRSACSTRAAPRAGSPSSACPPSTACGWRSSIHDLAPDARLVLVGYRTQEQFAEAAAWVAQQGIPVASHSNSFLTPPFDGTGGAARAVDAAAAAGVLWVNSAGNYAQRHWRGTAGASGTVLDIAPTAGTPLLLSLAWTSPMAAGSVSVERADGAGGWREVARSAPAGPLNATTPVTTADGGAYRRRGHPGVRPAADLRPLLRDGRLRCRRGGRGEHPHPGRRPRRPDGGGGEVDGDVDRAVLVAGGRGRREAGPGRPHLRHLQPGVAGHGGNVGRDRARRGRRGAAAPAPARAGAPRGPRRAARRPGVRRPRPGRPRGGPRVRGGDGAARHVGAGARAARGAGSGPRSCACARRTPVQCARCR